MAIRGVYSEGEKKMLADWKKLVDKGGYWLADQITPETPFCVSFRNITKEVIAGWASNSGDHNPLFWDENYARSTKWGGIIASPFFLTAICHVGRPKQELVVPPELGERSEILGGNRWKLYKPVRPGDTLRVYAGQNPIVDRTRADGKGLRMFDHTGYFKFFNQKDELIAEITGTLFIMIRPPDQKAEQEKVASFPGFTDYKYSEKELKAIAGMHDAEVRRGKSPRFWEDVNVGDELQPVAQGPITLWDSLVSNIGHVFVNPSVVHHTWEYGKKNPGFPVDPIATRFVKDPETNVSYFQCEHHHTDHVAHLLGKPMAFGYHAEFEHTLSRCLCNWMGDDGFVTAYEGRDAMIVPQRDTLFGRGKVVKKYIENGDHLVDIGACVEDIRGFIGHHAAVTIKLPSREDKM
jgi:acyl dehydratase